jgi:hypothetical protein
MLWGRNGDRQAAIDRLLQVAEGLRIPVYASAYREAAQLIKDGRIEYQQDKGQLYKVDIPEDSDLLDYDNPVSEEHYRAITEQARKEGRDYSIAYKDKANGKIYTDTGRQIYEEISRELGGDKAASEFLNRAGIPGLRYFDGNSRGKGEGSYNYVIWDESAINVLETFYQNQGNGARGSFNPETLTIRLLKAADPSTFLHEAGHFFLEMQTDLVGKLIQESSAFGIENLSPGERQMIADTETIMRWFGVDNLNQWAALTFDERRAYHEQFARGFEAYLFEGKAPSLEMAGIFSRFRQWLLRVYQSITSLNVKLDDSVRGVFDRMLAVDEQIALAKQARSLMPLFETPESTGMTPEEFAAYQSLGKEATAEAVAYLESKGLRDMKWIHNARGREISRLSKLARAKRIEMEIEARREVMSQPVYRAWQFLTGKISDEDKLAGAKKRKTNPDEIDPAQDSLMTAIGKLGGLDKNQAVSEWGISADESPASGLFGKPAWKKRGGRSLDDMAMALSQYGYLTLDENDRWEVEELREKFEAELSGSPQYSSFQDVAAAQEEMLTPAERVKNPYVVQNGRLDLSLLRQMYGDDNPLVALMVERGMTDKNGWSADAVAEILGGQFDSGDAMIQALAAAKDPKTAINELADQMLMEQYGELATPEAIEDAANAAIMNKVMARFVATEANALAKATGKSSRPRSWEKGGLGLRFLDGGAGWRRLARAGRGIEERGA